MDVMTVVLIMFVIAIAASLIVAIVGIIYRKVTRFKEKINELNKNINTITKTQNDLKLKIDAINGVAKNIDYLMSKNSINLYRQLQSARDIEEMIGEGYTRNLRGWVLSPDALLIILKYIDTHKPAVVLELGSGYSTVALAQFIKLKKLPTRIISVDHSDDFLNQTKGLISGDNKGLVAFVYAPLTDYADYKWYNKQAIERAVKDSGKKVEMVIVDGPPESTNPKARQPLLEQLKSIFNKDYTIILDDAARQDEKLAVEDWLVRDKALTHRFISTEKGLSILSTLKDINVNQLL